MVFLVFMDVTNSTIYRNRFYRSCGKESYEQGFVKFIMCRCTDLTKKLTEERPWTIDENRNTKCNCYFVSKWILNFLVGAAAIYMGF